MEGSGNTSWWTSQKKTNSAANPSHQTRASSIPIHQTGALIPTHSKSPQKRMAYCKIIRINNLNQIIPHRMPKVSSG
eukprot:255688-Amorphochlora_amoeboformis.AAC.1